MLPCFLVVNTLQKQYDAVIIGGGAAGITCAVAAKESNKNLKIAIIERNDRIGKKLLSTGNGRCNFSNKNITSQNYHGTLVPQLNKLLKHYDNKYITEFFNGIGLLSYSDESGRCYPISKQASSVVDVLRFACKRLGIDIFCDEQTSSIKKNKNDFKVITGDKVFICKKLVIACGSSASVKNSGENIILSTLENFGHKRIPFSSALCPVKVKSDVIKSLKGIRVVGTATIFDVDGKFLKTEKGEIQFSDNALSGICIFNLSLFSKKGCKIVIDLLPDYEFSDVVNLIKHQKQLFGECTKECLLTGILQKRLGQVILKKSGITDFNDLCSNISDMEIKSISKTIKHFDFNVIGKESLEHSQCSLGGIDGNEINAETMESKIIKNLFVCGEALDICGDCGGYNLHFAFSSGHIVGENL